MVAVQTRQARPWRLSATARKATLVIHLVAGVGWLGVDIVLLVLTLTGFTSDDPATVAACYQAMGLFVVPALLTAGLLSLASGILLGLGSKYGLLRYWWVAVKLGINLVLTGLVPVLLRPRVDQVSRLAHESAGGLDRDLLGRAATDLLFPPLVSGTALIIAVVLAVYKPWGLIRRTPRTLASHAREDAG
jgi:hypothetical protein